MSVPNNTSQGKREIRFDAHNRKPGIARFWRKVGGRRTRRWTNRINKWRVDGKVNLPPQDEEVRLHKPGQELYMKKWYSTFWDMLTEEERKALLDIRD